MVKTKSKTVDEYINSVPKEAKSKLKELRSILKSVSPKAKELIRWGYPALEEKRILFSYSAFKSHLNFMPTRTALEYFKKDLANYKTGKDTIQFPYDKPLPKTLIKKIASLRAKQVKQGALWMSSKRS